MYRVTTLACLGLLLALAGCGSADREQIRAEVSSERGAFHEAIRSQERKTTAVLAAAIPKVVRSMRMMERQARASELLADEYVCILTDAYSFEIEAKRPTGGFVAWSIANLHIRPHKVHVWKPSIVTLSEAVAIAQKADALPALFHASCAL